MKTLALLIGLLVTVIGVVGLLAPDLLMAAGRYASTTFGLYVLAALRIGVGLMLVGVSRVTRTPKTFRVIGAVLVVAGFVTPLFGVERTGAILDWLSAQGDQGSVLIRVVAAVLVAVGALFMYAVSTGPRSAR